MKSQQYILNKVKQTINRVVMTEHFPYAGYKLDKEALNQPSPEV